MLFALFQEETTGIAGVVNDAGDVAFYLRVVRRLVATSEQVNAAADADADGGEQG